MTTSITWAVQNMVSIPKPNVDEFVMTVNCVVTATDKKSTFSDFQSGVFDYDSDSSYGPYENITEAQAIAWVKESMGEARVAAFEQALIQKVYFMSNPVPQPAIKPLPWS